MLAPLEGTSDEHKVGAKIFRNAELVFQFNTAMRFTDNTLIEILEVMRTPGGKNLLVLNGRHYWQLNAVLQSLIMQMLMNLTSLLVIMFVIAGV